MTAVLSGPTRLAAAPDRRSWTIWGASPEAFHDRVWALRRIQVVRPGGPSPDPRGPRQYLLVAPGALVDFAPRAVMERLYWSRSRAVRVRVVSRLGSGYGEAVDCDGAGRLVRIRRDYARSSSATGRCWLTNDPRLAWQWRESGGRPRAWLWLGGLLHAGERSSASVPGRLGCSSDAGGAMSWLEEMVRPSMGLEHAFDGVYLYQPGVWAHESASIPPGTRFGGGALVGAGVDLSSWPVVIGPAILADEAATRSPAPMDWERLETPGHRLLPRARLRRGWWRRASKRVFDIAVSAAALACFAPLAPLVMLLIVLEDGRPVFFAHKRQTRGGREFPCLKFRTMVKDAERVKERLRAANQSDGAHFFMRDDPRLLRVGRWLRRFQIDEVPQFWNILAGHMSLVGPRPSPDRENQFCPAWREARLSVRPGLTGLWQVRRTREPLTDFQEWIRYDLEYVQRESWRLDLWIMLETVRTVVLGGRSRRGGPDPGGDGVGGAS